MLRSFMRRLALVLSAAFLSLPLAACAPHGGQEGDPEPGAGSGQGEGVQEMTEIELVIGEEAFAATLDGGEAAQAFARMLPLTLDMSELNGNEKYFNLDESLPTAQVRPGRIEAGDIMLYGASCVVLFYESFSTSYSYTPLGRVADASELASAVGGGSVAVTFRAR